MTSLLLLRDAGAAVEVALLEDGRLVELHREEKDADGLAGEVRRGVVRQVVPGLDAAFVDVGLTQPGYLHASDARRVRPLESLRTGEVLLLQVMRESVGSKGVRLSPNIALPGRLLVHLPLTDHVGISHRISDEAERERLRALVEAVRPPGTGWIARTAAVGADEADLRRDVEELTALWREISARAAAGEAPAPLWRDLGTAGRIVRDRAIGIDRIEAETEALAAAAREALGDAPVEVAVRPAPFEAHGVPAALEAALARRVPLPSGGHIVIDEAEAGTVIDVNSGRHVDRAVAETIRAVNLEAAEEVARQARLRNLGGVLLIDFIDMEREEDRADVLDAFRRAVAADPTRVHVVGWTGLGFLEATRKRIRPPLSASFQTCCLACGGLGRVARPADTI